MQDQTELTRRPLISLLTATRRHWVLAAVSLTAAAFFINAIWIPVKAELAQHLLERSWLRTLEGEAFARPWPWADTRAIGVLEVPRLRRREIVLEGSSGRNLAFGPTLVNVDGLEQTGDMIISGHRDTHFNFLDELQNGDLLRLRTTTEIRNYRVSWQEVIDSRTRNLVIEDNVDRLTLLTCYPLDSAVAGGPLRLVITALPDGDHG